MRDTSRSLDIFAQFLCGEPVYKIANQFGVSNHYVHVAVSSTWKRIRGKLLAEIEREKAAAKGINNERAEQRKAGNYI